MINDFVSDIVSSNRNQIHYINHLCKHDLNFWFLHFTQETQDNENHFAQKNCHLEKYLVYQFSYQNLFYCVPHF